MALQIVAETEKARKRAERFGAEFSAPSVELILDPEELRLYYKITQPEKAAPKAGRGAQYRSQVCAHLQGSARGPRPLRPSRVFSVKALFCPDWRACGVCRQSER